VVEEIERLRPQFGIQILRVPSSKLLSLGTANLLPLGSSCTPPSLRAVCPNGAKTNTGEHIMPYINAAQIPGNLGKDAETMTTQCGEP
jgi:hypothetical protein